MTSTEKMILGLGIGLAIGTALGVLYAPDKGKETRKKISDGFDRCRDKAMEAFDNLKHKAGCSAEELAQEISDEIAEKVAKVSGK